MFDRAVRLAPENALVRYRRAKILVSMRKYEVRNIWFRVPYVVTSVLTVNSFVSVMHKFSQQSKTLKS